MAVYTLYLDTVQDRWSSLFCDSIKAWQEALTDAFPNGSPVHVGDLTIPIASFKPKTLEDLVALGNSLEKVLVTLLACTVLLDPGWSSGRVAKGAATRTGCTPPGMMSFRSFTP